MASIKPLGQRVLVKRLDAEEVSAGGIVLPDTAQEKPQEAEVVALGTGGKDENGNDIQFSVEEGNKVLISKYGGTDVKVDGDDLLREQVPGRASDSVPSRSVASTPCCTLAPRDRSSPSTGPRFG